VQPPRTRNPDALGDQASPDVEAALADGVRPVVVLLPVGSVEPHGPHLPLVTDTLISEAAARRAVALLAERGVRAFVAPPVAYGVTDFARGFAGAVSVPPAALTAYLGAVVRGFLADARVAHVCLVSNHLEPAHDEAVRASLSGVESTGPVDPARASVASPLTRRWARTLSDEFKKGECHAGQYETAIVLACAPGLVDEERARALPALHVSLSESIRAGVDSFAEMGMRDAYSGTPAAATATEGEGLIERLATMVATEVAERLPPR
jgi:creatinine amidohydrolase